MRTLGQVLTDRTREMDYNYRMRLAMRDNDFPEEEPRPISEALEWIGRQFDIINQLRGQVIHLELKVIKLIEKKKVDNKYDPF